METMECMYKCVLSGNNKLSSEVRADLQTILEHIEKKDTEGASNFALKSLESGALSQYKNMCDKFMNVMKQSGGKRRRKTRGKRTKRHNKSMRGGINDKTYHRNHDPSDGVVSGIGTIVIIGVVYAVVWGLGQLFYT